MNESQQAFSEALKYISTVLYILVGCGLILGITLVYQLVWSGTKIHAFKPFDSIKDRKKPDEH
jgi:hypothetical protein